MSKSIPRYARIGMVLLVMGAIIVGIGTYLSKGSLSIYGLIMAICGFIIYFASSIASRKKASISSLIDDQFIEIILRGRSLSIHTFLSHQWSGRIQTYFLLC